MNEHFEQLTLRATGASALFKIEEIQSLWSGYGAISRYRLDGGDIDRVVVKHVILPDQIAHPRGWNTNLSHQRKIKSYQVESAWYQHYSARCGEHCYVPRCIGLDASEDQFLMILEDLDAVGFPVRKAAVTLDEMATCLRWLAHFHATFLGAAPESLWPVGTYWHLGTRPDELDALDDVTLKAAAVHIDAQLSSCPYLTLVHGDAKLANFCFSENSARVAAVDFQYVGGGCGMKDVAYFMGSCLDETGCKRYENDVLDIYFDELVRVIPLYNSSVDAQAVEQSWRDLFPVAWADFHRFIKGWSPGHWKINSYSERVARQVVSHLARNPIQDGA